MCVLLNILKKWCNVGCSGEKKVNKMVKGGGDMEWKQGHGVL